MGCYLVTGGGGFIGSNLVRALLAEGSEVRVIDDFSTGRRENLAGLEDSICLFDGSICDIRLLAEAMAGVTCCFHQAAIPSVPRSVEDPIASNAANVDGTLNVFWAAHTCGVKRVVYASSSSVYGDAALSPVVEDMQGAPISPYGVGKAASEMYAAVFSNLYGIDLVGLRYFNVFGPRQDPNSKYAAVIPIFIRRILAGEAPEVDGDGGQGRDFTYVDNVVAANLLAAAQEVSIAGVYNIACGESTDILGLVAHLNEALGTSIAPAFRAARPGDIRSSLADIGRAERAFGYRPQVGLRDGLSRTIAWIKEGV